MRILQVDLLVRCGEMGVLAGCLLSAQQGSPLGTSQHYASIEKICHSAFSNFELLAQS